jgi:hypothetical protein
MAAGVDPPAAIFCGAKPDKQSFPDAKKQSPMACKGLRRHGFCLKSGQKAEAQ